MFTGTIRMRICEAVGLRPTDFQKRHNMTFGKPDEQSIDPYVSIDVDENHLGKSLGGRASRITQNEKKRKTKIYTQYIDVRSRVYVCVCDCDCVRCAISILRQLHTYIYIYP